MFLAYRTEELSKILIFITLSLFGYFSFEQPLFFALVLVLTYLSIGIVERQNSQLLTLLAILLAGQVSITTFELLDPRNEITKSVIYLITFAFLVKFKHDNWCKTLGMIWSLSFFADLYWHFVDYPAPDLYFYLCKACVYAAVSIAIIYRPHVSKTKLNIRASWFYLDKEFKRIYRTYIAIESLMIIEYCARHFNLTESLLAYNSYEYAIHIISLVEIYLILSFAAKHKLKKVMSV